MMNNRALLAFLSVHATVYGDIFDFINDASSVFSEATSDVVSAFDVATSGAASVYGVATSGAESVYRLATSGFESVYSDVTSGAESVYGVATSRADSLVSRASETFAGSATSTRPEPSQSTADVCNEDIKVTSQSDLDKITECEVFNGRVQIVGLAGSLVLNGVRRIEGSLTLKNMTQLDSFSAPLLEEISDDFRIEQAIRLTTLSLPRLNTVGNLYFQTLPQLRQMSFDDGVKQATTIFISDTSLVSLKGLNLSQVETFNVNNNRNINDISVNVTSIVNTLDISFNAPNVNVSLPNLVWASNATFQFCGSVDMPVLERVNISLGYVNNTAKTFQAPNLEEIGGSLAFVSNAQLVNMSFPQLNSIGGGFQVANNSNLTTVAFPKVRSVGGAINFVGNLTTVSLPALRNVEGVVFLNSSNDLDCSTFDSYNKKKYFKSKYTCKGVAKPKVSSSSSRNASSTSFSSSASSSAAASTSEDSSSGSSSRTKSSASSSSIRTSSAASSADSNLAAANIPLGAGVLGTLYVMLFQLF